MRMMTIDAVKRFVLTLNEYFFDMEDVSEVDYLNTAPLLLLLGPAALAVIIFTIGFIVF